MRTVFRRLALRAGVPILAICHAVPAVAQDRPAPESPAVRITGRVVDAATGEPVAGVFLHAFPGLVRAYTDEHGVFRMEAPAGPYLVWYSSFGYPDVSARIAVSSDTTLPDYRISALPPLPEGSTTGRVMGTMVDVETGAPLRDARVAAAGGATSVTDERGAFDLRRLPEGSVYVSFSRLGYESVGAMVEAQSRTQLGLVALREDAVELEGLEVVVDRLEDRRRAAGWSARLLSGDEVRRSTARTAYQLITDRMGIHPTQCFQLLAGGGDAMQGQCFSVRGTSTVPEVFVDEVKLREGLSGLQYFRAHEFERVEVFGAGRQIRLYTPAFLRWMAGSNFAPSPLTAP